MDGHTISQLADANETRHVLVEDLEAATVLFWLAGVAEAAWAVEDLGEGLEVDCPFHRVSLCLR